MHTQIKFKIRRRLFFYSKLKVAFASGITSSPISFAFGELSLPFTYLIRADFLEFNDKENKNIGFIIYRKKPFYKENRYNIDLLVIKKNFRNNGFGSKLLDKMVSQIEMHNPKISKIIICSQTIKFDNLVGNYFYQKNNFELKKSDHKFNSYLKTIEI